MYCVIVILKSGEIIKYPNIIGVKFWRENTILLATEEDTFFYDFNSVGKIEILTK